MLEKKFNVRIQEQLQQAVINISDQIELGKKILAELSNSKYFHEAYRKLKINEQKGQKALYLYLAYGLGVRELKQ